ncbi:hypothetical protein PIB30_083857 [Stylosanthes scabra]|uniref:Uncharacterized protein n=1 Tax=Stylosanthes scabra TaxID=79078 RepID=A0ABU6TT64_9FABA|nr:hypothetical protein [Stylosanthes scabra]
MSPDEIPAVATQRVADTPPRATQVDDVPDNRRTDRHRMVGTRTTARDWQWLDEMMGEDIAASRRVRCMLEGGGHRGGRGGGRVGGRAPLAQPQVVRAIAIHIRQGLVKRVRPGFDGSQGQIQADLNEPASAPYQLFMAYAWMHRSTYMPDPYVRVLDPAPAPTT